MNPETTLQGPPFTLRLLRRFVVSLPRGRHLMVRWITPRFVHQPPFRATFDGGQQVFVAGLRNSVARSIFFYGFYENVQTAVLLRVLRPGHTVIDAGANIGYFSLLAARRVGTTGRVFAFEPEPANATLLRQNVTLNGYQSVTVEEAAVGAAVGRTRLSVPGPDQWDGDVCTTVLNADANPQNTVEVPVVSLDRYCREHGIARVDVLKMDIEGGEAAALEGMRGGIREGTYRRVFLELHPRKLRLIGRTAESILDTFLEAGYSCWRMLNHPPGFLHHYSVRFRDDLLVRDTGTRVDEYWPHFLLMAKDISLTDE